MPTGFKDNRSKFLKQITEEEAKNLSCTVRIEGENGVLIEKPSMIDKYMKMDRNINPMLNKLTYLQFCKRYSASTIKPKSGELLSAPEPKDQSLKTYTSVNFIVTHDYDILDEVYLLPKVIQLSETIPGEPKFMRLKKTKVARFHKFSPLKNPHEFYFAELQLYIPFQSENELEPDSFEKCKLKYDETSDHNSSRKVSNVKKIIMEHLEDVTAGTEKAKEFASSEIGDIMDVENTQENIDCELAGIEENPVFEAINPDNLNLQNDTIHDSSFKRIELIDNSRLIELTRQLDSDQRIVLDKAVAYAIDIIKPNIGEKTSLKPPLLIVQGGAGTGKSRLIEVLSHHLERILRKSGDNPGHPYILKLAYTGTAAANIGGQILHSAFALNFGRSYMSLNDKVRDEKITTLQNLLFIIIDEYSFIDADMLYKLDLRLKEVKRCVDLNFGGVAVLFFGDILQLKPVRARYICEEPMNESFLLCHILSPLWEKFDVIMLNQNHRQGEDRLFAELLNRAREGMLTEDDEKLLETRVCPKNHPDIPKNALAVTCINKKVNQIN